MKPLAEFAVAGAVMAGVTVIASVPAAARQPYPTWSIRLVVPYPAGGVADVPGRMMGQRLSAQYGQPIVVENLPVAIAHIRAGNIRAIGMTSRQRSPSMPEVPTITETGVPDYEATAWFTIGAPARVPADIVRKLNADIDAWLKAPDMRGGKRWA